MKMKLRFCPYHRYQLMSISFQYEKIAFNLNRIKIDLDDEEVLIQMESTMAQMIHQPIRLHAKGCFDINYRTLMEVINGDWRIL